MLSTSRNTSQAPTLRSLALWFFAFSDLDPDIQVDDNEVDEPTTSDGGSRRILLYLFIIKRENTVSLRVS
jgi:hypothetical protein